MLDLFALHLHALQGKTNHYLVFNVVYCSQVYACTFVILLAFDTYV